MIKKKYLITIMFIALNLLTITMIAQNSSGIRESAFETMPPDETLSDDDTIVQPFDSLIGLLPESIDTDMQKLLEEWHVKHFSRPEDYCADTDENPYFDDSEYELRMRSMPFVVPMTYNATVRRCIDLYTGRLRKIMRYMMGMADFYFPMIEQTFDINGLPLELKYVAVVESALNPIAQSRVGACGLWQFMLPTGKVYGLEINSLIDERLDPQKATEAACRYFKEMYALYGDWLLSIAAYNCGPGNVNKAIRRYNQAHSVSQDQVSISKAFRRSDGQSDFWKIYPYLPRETRSYVPLFIAAAYVMTYHCEHNICPVRANFSVATDTLMICRSLHFDQIADILQMDKEAIRFYNPQYKREIVPGNIRPSVLRLPVDMTFAFIDNSNSIYAHRLDELLTASEPVDNANRNQRITHTVKTGETLYTIANQYGISVQSLRRWNGLRGSRVPPGKKLRVNIDNGGLTYASREPEPKPAPQTQTQTQAQAQVKTQTPPAKPKQSDAVQSAVASTTYTVQAGDTLYAIAKRYPGLSAESLQRYNGLKTTSLRIGQILKIPIG